MSVAEIARNVDHVREEIAAACARANRDPSTVTLVAICKQKSVADVLEAVAAGVRHFGENRVEEAQTKIPEVELVANVPLDWHMVGHIQSRKARHVIPLFRMIHSVDSVKLADKLSRLADEQGKKLDVLLEISISGEESKYGFDATAWKTDSAVRDRLWQQVEHITSLPGLRVHGLMTMAPFVDDMEQTRPVFAGLAELRAALAEALEFPLPELSMGMTDDYPVAVEEGATLVRIGRAIFGERNT